MATEHKNENLSVEERLKTLYKLQLIHSDIRRIRAIRGELPQEVKDLSDTIKGLVSRIERFQGEIDNCQARRLDEINKIENKKLLIDRYKQQLDNVRNNHEFDNLTKEIEYETLEIQLSEKISETTSARLTISTPKSNLSNLRLTTRPSSLKKRKLLSTTS